MDNDNTVSNEAHEGDPFMQPTPSPEMLAAARQLRHDFDVIQMENEAAIEEVLTKVSILRKEFMQMHRYNPIEHINSRVKSPASALKKAARRGISPTPAGIRAGITDMAGVRITCSFIADTYRVLETLTSQADVKVLRVKDYIAHPKPNGYKSLHALIEIPIFLSTGPVPVTVELQVRTIAMDFWASLEHKIYYKYEGTVPAHLVENLTAAAQASEQLDEQMEQLFAEVRGSQDTDPDNDQAPVDDGMLLQLWNSAQAQSQQVQSECEKDARPEG